VIRCLFWGAVCGLVIGGASLLAPKAHSDPADIPYLVCGALASDPTIANVSRILDTIHADGLTIKQAADVVADSVTTTCPRYLPLLERFINTYTPDVVASAGDHVNENPDLSTLPQRTKLIESGWRKGGPA
jgi:hypothetical protein